MPTRTSHKGYHNIDNEPAGSENLQPASPPDDKLSLWRRWWLFGITSSVISLLAFAALVVVLAHCDSTSQRTWLFSRLTLNGLVALLATITRTALMISVGSCLSQGAWNWFSNTRKRTFPRERTLGDLEMIDAASRGSWGSMQLLWRTKGL